MSGPAAGSEDEVGSLFGKEAETRDASLVERSARSLRGAAAALGGSAVVAALADIGTAARELTKAERRRRQRQRERDDEDDDRKRNSRDDEDDGDDWLSLFRSRHVELRDRMSSPTRQETSRQSAEDADDRGSGSNGGEEDGGNGTSGGRRTRSDDDGTTERGSDVTEAIQAPQSVESGSLESASSGAIRIGSGDTFASIDPETGTAIAESNGVRAIAGPEGAFIEGTPGTSSPPPTTGTGGRSGAGDDAGGDNGDGFVS